MARKPNFEDENFEVKMRLFFENFNIFHFKAPCEDSPMFRFSHGKPIYVCSDSFGLLTPAQNLLHLLNYWSVWRKP